LRRPLGMSVFFDSDHDILRRLANELLPWMAGGALLRRRWVVYLAGLYSYGSEAMSAVGALGVGSSVIPAFRGTDPNGFDLATAFSGPWFWPGVVCLAGRTALRIVIARENIVARAICARDCAQAMQKLQHDLDKALATTHPGPAIVIIREAVAHRVGEAIDKGIWRWTPPFPDTPDVAIEVDRRLADIRARFGHHWTGSAEPFDAKRA
jgi:hypothetical protein